ncbi:hypothetical protein BA746_00465 [Vibrio parahaemolyticus]|nr:hypothetical protein BA746_00465 [Vibrio parahaemolyticus]
MEKKYKSMRVFFTHEQLNYQHLKKSFFNIPKEISIIRNVNVEMNCFNEDHLTDDIVEIFNMGKISKIKAVNFFKVILRIFNTRHHTDCLMLLHLNLFTALIVLFSKLMIKDVKIYLKLDINKEFFELKLNLIKFYILRLALKSVDCISYESINVSRNIKNSSIFSGLEKKLVHIPNCVPEANNYDEPSFESKENIFITVGRLGSFQKNTEMILDALENSNLENWDFYFVGPTTQQVECRLKRLNQERNNIKYIGEVKCRTKLIKLYERSKVFVLSSRYEGFATVLAEAGLFGNFIVSTDVNGAKDITIDFIYGLEIRDANSLKQSIKSIVNGSFEFEPLAKKGQKYVRQKFNWNFAIRESKVCELLEV